jgi:hypothetical protein
MRELQIVTAVELAKAYAQARYVVMLDGDPLPLHVGQPAPDVEAYWPARRYGLVTAWNPASMPPLSEAANQAADAALVARLDALGLSREPAFAFDQTGQWREASWLLRDVEPAVVDMLGREFGQAAVLAWSSGEPVRLRMLMTRPAQATPDDAVEWALG